MMGVRACRWPPWTEVDERQSQVEPVSGLRASEAMLGDVAARASFSKTAREGLGWAVIGGMIHDHSRGGEGFP